MRAEDPQASDSYEALRTEAAAVDLSNRGKIRVTGEDRARLLHAMCTNHIEGLKEGDGLYAFFLTAQGRIIGDAYIYDFGDSFLLDTEPELGAKLSAHLDRYIIADDVEVADETSTWAAIGLEGPQSLERAENLGIPVPEREFGVRKDFKGGFVARVASTGPQGLRLFVPADEREALLRRLAAAGIPKASTEEANVVRLENGIPRYGTDISDKYLVQETGLMHGVHPAKGCYVGQEIVERVRSRAQIHRNLRSLRISGSSPPEAGSKLLLGGKEIGEITSAAFSPALGETVALAYVRIEAIGSGEQSFGIAGAEAAVTARLSQRSE